MNDDQIYLEEILDRIVRIEFYTKEGKEMFDRALLIQDGVIRCFEVIGEAVKQLSSEIKQKYPNVPWRKIAGFRDVLIHDYMGIDLDEVWNVIEINLPGLKQEMITIITNEQNTN